jgi:tetratricopeptide (TPR) repeat protein
MTDEYNKALSYFEKVLKIRQTVLPSNHPQIAAINSNIGWLFECQGDYSNALDYYQKSLEIARKTLSSTHCLVIGAQDNIQKLKTKIKK